MRALFPPLVRLGLGLRASVPPYLGIWRLRETQVHHPQRFLAAKGEVSHEIELLAALLHVGLQLVVRAPGFLLHDNADLRFGHEVAAGLPDLSEAPAHRLAVVVGVQVEVRHAQYAVAAAGPAAPARRGGVAPSARWKRATRRERRRPRRARIHWIRGCAKSPGCRRARSSHLLAVKSGHAADCNPFTSVRFLRALQNISGARHYRP